MDPLHDGRREPAARRRVVFVDTDSGLIQEIRAYYAAPQPSKRGRVELAEFDYGGRGYHLECPVARPRPRNAKPIPSPYSEVSSLPLGRVVLVRSRMCLTRVSVERTPLGRGALGERPRWLEPPSARAAPIVVHCALSSNRSTVRGSDRRFSVFGRMTVIYETPSICRNVHVYRRTHQK